MKKILFVIAYITAFNCFFAQEAEAKNTPHITYETHISAATAWPLEMQAAVTEVFKIPVLNFDNPLTRNNNIAFKLGAKISPVTLEGTFDVVWTPIAFLEVYGGASIGSGWSIKKIHGLSLNTANVYGKTDIIPINFRRAFYSANLGGAFQFDVGAVVPGDWTHIIFRMDQYILYRAVTATDAYTSWVFQNDSGQNRNGLTYYGAYVFGYQMPLLPINLVAFQIETKKTAFQVKPGQNKKNWGEDRISVVFGPILNFKVTDIFSIVLIAQWKTVHPYSSNDDPSRFYQNRRINKTKNDTVSFKRVGVIFNITIPHN